VVACAKRSLRNDAGTSSLTSCLCIRWPDEHVLPDDQRCDKCGGCTLFAGTVVLTRKRLRRCAYAALGVLQAAATLRPFVIRTSGAPLAITMLTATAQGIPGGPINVGLIGTREGVIRAFHAADWYPADPVTLRTSVEIIGSVLLDRRYESAPVSPLFFEGRHEDLAFEKADGISADRRQHVRLWLVLPSGADAEPVWLGAVTFDSGVTLSRDTGQVTHRIAPNIDKERGRLIEGLNNSHMVTTIYQMKGIGPTLNGRNGEGDPSPLTERYGWRDSSVPAKRQTSLPKCSRLPR
jgi:LssY C-terminus